MPEPVTAFFTDPEDGFVKATKLHPTDSEMVQEFHQVFGCDIDERSMGAIQDRLTLLDEEYGELMEELVDWTGDDGGDFGGIRDPRYIDWEKVAKELTDILYIVHGAAVAWGIDLAEAMRIVHESNMSKIWPDGRPRVRQDGKILKPPTYQVPDMSSTVKELP